MDVNAEFTSPIASIIVRFLSLKTALGRRYDTERNFLRSLDAFLTAIEAIDLTAETFEQWCQTRAHLKSGIRRYQMRIVRNLCLYRRRTEPGCFVPDIELFPSVHQYITPYCFSEDEIARLVAAADILFMTSSFPLRARAVRLGLVLLYTAGLRRGELVRLTLGDYDPAAKTVLVRHSKFHKSRLLPLSADAVRELEAYLSVRRAYRPETVIDNAPLIWRGGVSLQGYSGSAFGRIFRDLIRKSGIRKADGELPRLHDIRHTFALTALLRWYRDDADVQSKLPFLSAYMGHVSIASTQYYLRFLEPLSSAASERFAQHCGKLVTPLAKEGA